MLWHVYRQLLSGERPRIRGRRPPALTPRRLGALEALALPAARGGNWSPFLVRVTLAVIFSDIPDVREILAGDEKRAGRIVERFPEGDMEQDVREITNYMAASLFRPPKYEKTGETRQAFGYACPASIRLVAMALKHGLGSGAMDFQNSVWDIPCGEILAVDTALGEMTGQSEFETADEHAAAEAALKMTELENGRQE